MLARDRDGPPWISCWTGWSPRSELRRPQQGSSGSEQLARCTCGAAGMPTDGTATTGERPTQSVSSGKICRGSRWIAAVTGIRMMRAVTVGAAGGFCSESYE